MSSSILYNFESKFSRKVLEESKLEILRNFSKKLKKLIKNSLIYDIICVM